MRTNLHSEFKLNGSSYTIEELNVLAEDWLRKGLPFEREIGQFIKLWLDVSPSIKVKTSGSTGTPKVITLQKAYMINSALATGEYFELQAGMSALLCLPATYIAGKMMLVRAMVLGLKLDCIAPSMNPLVNSVTTYDFGAMVPMQLENSLTRINSIKTVIVGGAPISNRLKEKVIRKGLTIFETYGMTETITHVAVRIIGFGFSNTRFRALPNVVFSIDERNCLVITAPNVADQVIVTNDIVALISETAFEWLGRYDRIINSGGVKLQPEQIEQKLESLIVNRFFIAGLADDKLGEQLVLIIEGHLDTNKLLHELRESKKLDPYEIPKAVYTIPKFVESNSGKIRRAETLGLINN